MIIATRLGPHTGEGILLLAITAPLVAFISFRLRALYRIGLALTGHALAFALAVDFGARRRDTMVYDLIETLRFSRPSLREGLDGVLFFYGIVFVILLLPAFCAVFMILFPAVTRSYLHVIALIFFCGFLGIGFMEASSGTSSFLDMFPIILGFGIMWILMRFSPDGGMAEQGTGGNAI